MKQESGILFRIAMRAVHREAIRRAMRRARCATHAGASITRYLIICWCAVSVLRDWVGAPAHHLTPITPVLCNAKSGGGCSARSPLTMELVPSQLTPGEAGIAVSVRDEVVKCVLDMASPYTYTRIPASAIGARRTYRLGVCTAPCAPATPPYNGAPIVGLLCLCFLGNGYISAGFW